MTQTENDLTRRRSGNPLIEVFEPIRQRILRERWEEGERRGYHFDDFPEDWRPPETGG